MEKVAVIKRLQSQITELQIARGNERLRDVVAQRFAAQNMEQNARRSPAVRGLLFDQRARRENRTVIYLLQRRPLVQIFERLLDDRLRLYRRAQSFTRLRNQRGQRVQIERTPDPIIQHMELRFWRSGSACLP